MSDFWSVNEGTFFCLYDPRRTRAFRRAIRATVAPGDVVVEMGAGSGVLSMFAADAGASRVYAVELDQANLTSLRDTVVTNGYEDRIVVLEGDATTIELPERVDVIICEMIATGLLEELQLPAMANAMRWAKDGVKVVLQRYHVFADLVEHKNRYHGKVFNTIRYELPDKPSLRATVRSDPALLVEVDFRRRYDSTLLERTVPLTVMSAGTVNGLRISGTTVFHDGSRFDSSVSYSFPVILPIDDLEVDVGDRFRTDISYSMCDGPHRLRYSVTPMS
ncbi:MAG: 50S ribosomal protein L11 methyltransferase [Acidimicrobiales bacterium]